MKKAVIGFVVFFLALATLTSCLIQTGPDADDADGFLYVPGSTVNIVRAEGSDIDISAYRSRLFDLTGRVPSVIYDDSEEGKHEIVLGDTLRAITADAGAALNAHLATVGADTYAFLIYSDGSSVAIVWNSDLKREEAIEYFLDNYMNESSLKLGEGELYYHSEQISREEMETARREAELDSIGESLGSDARAAMNAYLELFDERFYRWLAGLYDPETGALYYSDSGRNTLGYLPDIESTTRGYGWLSSSGMLENYGGDLKAALPDWLVRKLLDWMIPMQSPKDGYFYHPQWSHLTTSVSRLGRDLDNATSFITRLGGKVLYDTANGYKGVYGAPASAALTAPFEHSSEVVAAAKTVAAAYPAHLQSVDAFLDYLDSFDWDNKSYSAGSTLEAQAYQIKAAGPEFISAYKEYMDSRQEHIQAQLRAKGRPENGLWETDITYSSVNGLMKIISSYTRLEIPLNYAEAAFESALQIAKLTGADLSGAECSAVVNVYNPWSCMNQGINNVNSFGDKTVAANLRARLRADAAELIRVTAQKVAEFKREDGSFGYGRSGSMPSSQGMPVALYGADEGDVNGATIATTAVISHMCGALGVKAPQLYFGSDFDKFMTLIESAGEIVKDEVVKTDATLDFEDEELGTDSPNGITKSIVGGSVTVIDDLVTDSDHGRVLEFVTRSNGNDYIRLDPIVVAEDTVYVLEWDMNVTENRKNTTLFQIRLGTGYMLTVSTGTDGYVLGDSSGESGAGIVYNNFAGKHEYGKWYTFRVEFYLYPEEDGEPPKTKIYVDGECVAESRNFYGNLTDGSVVYSPNVKNYSLARFFALSSADATVLFDNIMAQGSKQ